MFGFRKSKTASQRNLYATAEAELKLAKTAWDSADVDRRTSLLKKAIDIKDDKLFLAYVHAPWPQIPGGVQLKLDMAMIEMEFFETLARKIGEVVALCFSAEQLIKYFGQKTFTANWTFNDALGVWYCLGRFCFLVSVGSLNGIHEADVAAILDVGQKHLMAGWKMSGPTLQRFEEFNGTKLEGAYSIYKSITDGQAFARFFSLFVSAILGNDISFSPNEFSLGWLAQILQSSGEFDMDPVLTTEISSLFVEVGDMIRSPLSRAVSRHQALHNI